MKPGDSLDGRYTIVQRLGAGGMGEVYKATHDFLGTPRVIKVVHPQISGSDDAHERFLREARAATLVQHPNVATLHDFAALPDGAHYMVWEFIDGENLAQRLRTRGTLPPAQAVRIAVQALRGLDAIHRAGIIHRDISPENLMITASDEVKIIDLGVAKVDDPDAVSQTRTGIFVGKLRYASPEQLGFLPDGEKVDARADIYGMAMVIVELLTGRPPYEAKSPHEYFLLHAREPQAKKTVELPAELAASTSLSAILEKALARDRTLRYASAGEFADALETVARTLPVLEAAPTMMVARDTIAVPATTAQKTVVRETERTAAPAPIPAAPTVRTPMPRMLAEQPVRHGVSPALFVGVIAVAVLAIGSAVLWPRTRERAPLVATGGAPTASTPAQQASALPGVSPQPAPAATTLTVQVQPPDPATDTVGTETTPAHGSTAATAAPERAVVRTQPAAPKEASQPPPVVSEAAAEPEAESTASEITRPIAVPVYIDGGEDDDTNERALEQLRRELRGTTKLALRAGGMHVELARELKENLPEVELVPYASVVIRFDGTMERLGRGRKLRAATAVVLKNERIVFRYELPREEFRVGMHPQEAFVRVLSEALQ